MYSQKCRSELSLFNYYFGKVPAEIDGIGTSSSDFKAFMIGSTEDLMREPGETTYWARLTTPR